MTFSAALPGAALRVMRTAVGRRALQLALLVSGLFALGLLCGEQAHAADGVLSTTSAKVVRHPQSASADGIRAETRAAIGRLVNPPAEPADDDAAAPGTSRPNGTPRHATSATDCSEADSSEPNRAEPNRAEPAATEPDLTERAATEPVLPELNLLELVAPEPIAPRPTAPEATTPQGNKADKLLPQPSPTPHPSAPTPSLSPRSRPSADTALRPVTDQVLRPVTDQVLRPVTEDVVGSVDEQVVRPVGDLVTGVTEGLAEGLAEVQGKIPPLSLLPSLPESPILPELPGLVPGLPELPVLPLLPGQTLPAPVTATPQPGAEAGSQATEERPAKERTDEAAVVAYGPAFVADVTPGGDATHVAGHRVRPTEYAPERQEPAGDPGGSLGSRSAADGGTSRHGDAFAVQLNHRAPLRLVAGAAARIDAAETRDRHPDIPVSPA
ncbi:hypothetical protein [Streptomyces sp. GESEQ-35]|uniref:hypothetical protein n=1 Tax=Streptomyces sp. GESEQ-35 TaxID=2812657 RepID=UPI001B33B443|nr:hypothetical protein [Streptomyces sp. GESEQ-35]